MKFVQINYFRHATIAQRKPEGKCIQQNQIRKDWINTKRWRPASGGAVL